MNEPNQQHPRQPEPKSTLKGLEGFFDTYFREKAPFQFPPGARERIVRYGPWVMLVFLILGAIILVPAALIALGLSTAVAPFAGSAGTSGMTGLGTASILLSIVVLIMEAVAIPSLLKRKLSGWKLMYYASLLSAVCSLLNMSIIGAVVSLAISMYILFQVRSYYK